MGIEWGLNYGPEQRPTPKSPEKNSGAKIKPKQTIQSPDKKINSIIESPLDVINFVDALQKSKNPVTLIQKQAKIKGDGVRGFQTNKAAQLLLETFTNIQENQKNEAINNHRSKIEHKAMIYIDNIEYLENSINIFKDILRNQQQFNKNKEFDAKPDTLIRYLQNFNHNTQDYQQILRNIQTAWAKYFGIEVTRSGKWGKYTETILRMLKADPNFKTYQKKLESILNKYRANDPREISKLSLAFQRQRKNKLNTAKSIAQENTKQGISQSISKWNSIIWPKNAPLSKATPELYKPSIKGSARKEKNEEKADTTALSQKISKEQKTSSELSTTLSNIPIKSVETSIPKDQYQQAIHSFLQHKIANTDTIDIRFLVEQIANENGSGALYEKYSKMRNASPDKQRLLEQQRQSLQQEVKKQAESIAITTIKNSLKQMGVPIDQGNFVQDGRGGYVKFQDPTDPNINVFYRPSSGFISMRNFNAINPELKSVDTSGYHYHILSKMPSYQELIDQASDPLWLPNKRLSTQEEMKDHILDSLKSQITYNAGNIEQELMKEKISSTKRETNIIHQTKKLLGIEKPICSEQEQKAAYQILRQLWNSCKNLTFEELKKLNTFVNQLVSWLENSKNGTKNYQAEEKWPHIPNPKTPLELLTLITDQTSIQELKDHWGHQDMQQFGVGKLFARLSKPMPGKDEHYNIIDMQKLNLLLEYQESPEILRNPEHWKSYAELLKNTIDPYRKRAENQEQNIAQQQAQQAYNTIQLMPQQERGYA